MNSHGISIVLMFECRNWHARQKLFAFRTMTPWENHQPFRIWNPHNSIGNYIIGPYSNTCAVNRTKKLLRKRLRKRLRVFQNIKRCISYT